MKDVIKKIVSKFDLRDGFFFTGLILVGVGFWIVEPLLAFIIVGGILIAISIKPSPKKE